MDILDKYLKKLNEAYAQSTLKRTRAEKTRASAGTLALYLARKNNDPLYKKMQLHRSMFKETKKQLLRKYQSKANMLARERAAKYKA